MGAIASEHNFVMRSRCSAFYDPTAPCVIFFRVKRTERMNQAILGLVFLAFNRDSLHQAQPRSIQGSFGLLLPPFPSL